MEWWFMLMMVGFLVLGLAEPLHNRAVGWIGIGIFFAAFLRIACVFLPWLLIKERRQQKTKRGPPV